MLAALAVSVGAAVPATAASDVPTATKISDGAYRLGWQGRTYVCYRGDACVWRNGVFTAYYACQTVQNGHENSVGWIFNNQTGNVGVALHLWNGDIMDVFPRSYATKIGWHGVHYFHTCATTG